MIRAALDYAMLVKRHAGRPDAHDRALWLHVQAKRAASAIELKVNYTGSEVTGGLLVANHLSYLDVLLLAARQPVTFVAKKEVRSWPVLGWFGIMAGTLFIDRSRRSSVMELRPLMGSLLAAGGAVVLFPEGTSSSGRFVLSFKRGLIQPAIDTQAMVTPVGLHYAALRGSVERDVCFWGDMNFAPHFLRLLLCESVRGAACYGVAIRPGGDRKVTGMHLWESVGKLHIAARRLAEGALEQAARRDAGANLPLDGQRAASV